jgi:peroxiredoxin
MNILLLIFRLALSVVFGLAAVAKLADYEGTRRAAVSFGAPQKLATPLARLLPFAELAVALALLPVESAWWGALGALALLLIFITAIATNLARGQTPDCHCFGQLHSAPVGWSVLLRNLVLAVLAGLVAWQGREDAGPDALSWLRNFKTVELVQFIVGLAVLGLLVAVTLILVQILKQQKEVLLRLEELELSLEGERARERVHEDLAPLTTGLPVGAPAPDFSLPGVAGMAVSLDTLLAEKRPVLLLFISPNCTPCASLSPEIKRWQRDYTSRLTIALISRDTPAANLRKFTEFDTEFLLLQKDSEVSTLYEARWTPSAVLLTTAGVIGSQLALGVESIISLAEHAASANAKRPWLAAPGGQHNGHQHDGGSQATAQLGAPAPPFRLPDLSGKTVELDQFRGHQTMLLFWNPDCGFCQQMLEDLRRLERDPPKRAPGILIVSTGTVEANRAMNLDSPIVLDQHSNVLRAYGSSGTPSAVLVDSTGHIASLVATGAPGVLALAGVREEKQG